MSMPFDFTYNNAVFASGTVDIDPAGAVNAMLVSVDAGIAIHIIRRVWKISTVKWVAF